MRAQPDIHLGYEVGTGEPVAIPHRHMCVVGQTQESGKTTTLEALCHRGKGTFLAFVTKRGERVFAGDVRVRPYFRDRADWQFVCSIIDATLQEKNKFLRPWIMKICRTTRTLRDVQREVRRALEKAKGINEGVYTQLDAYLDLIVPEIERSDLAPRLELRDGALNTMDLADVPGPMQMLFVQSAIDWVNALREDTTVIVPEAWEFIPEGKGSPVKASAVDLVRKGGGIGNRIWADSQDTAGVDKVILRGCTVWLIGVQREANEIKRNLANIPAGIKRPKPQDVATLKRGQFYACWGTHAVKAYVQPEWMDEQEAKAIAKEDRAPQGQRPDRGPPLRRGEPVGEEVRGTAPGDRGRRNPEVVERPGARVPRGGAVPGPHAADGSDGRGPPDEGEAMSQEQLDRIEQGMRQLREFVERGQRVQAAADAATGGIPPVGRGVQTSALSATEAARQPNGIVATPPLEDIYAFVKARLIEEQDPALLRILTSRPELVVEVERHELRVDGASLQGRVGRLIEQGFFREPKTHTAVRGELKRTGPDVNNANLGKVLATYVAQGFLAREGRAFAADPGAKVRVEER